MKSELILPASPVEKPETFPLLRKSKLSGSIVMFTSMCKGTVIKEGIKPHSNDLGYFSDNWCGYTCRDTWEKLPEGTVIQLTA